MNFGVVKQGGDFAAILAVQLQGQKARDARRDGQVIAHAAADSTLGQGDLDGRLGGGFLWCGNGSGVHGRKSQAQQQRRNQANAFHVDMLLSASAYRIYIPSYRKMLSDAREKGEEQGLSCSQSCGGLFGVIQL